MNNPLRNIKLCRDTKSISYWSEGERKQATWKTFETIVHENLFNLAKEANNLKIQKMQKTPPRYYIRWPFPRNIAIRFSKIEIKKKKNVKGSYREGKDQLQRDSTRLTGNLLTETLQARRYWGIIFSILKENKFQPNN